VFWAVAGRTQAAEGKLATSFFAAEIGLNPISAFAKNSGALAQKPSPKGRQKQKSCRFFPAAYCFPLFFGFSCGLRQV